MALLITLSLSACTTPIAPDKSPPTDKPSVSDKTEPGKPTAPPTPEDIHLLQEADESLEMDDPERAESNYRLLVDKFPGTPLATEAMVKLGKMLIDRGGADEVEGESLLRAATQNHLHPFAWEGAWWLGDYLTRQGDREEGWGYLSAVIQNDTPRADSAWLRIVESYFSADPMESTVSFYRSMPSPLTQTQLQGIFMAADLLSRPRLEAFLTLQPAGSPIRPVLELFMGDRLLQDGNGPGANQWWRQAMVSGQNMPTIQTEAKHRLYEPASSDSPFLVGLILPLSGKYATLGNNLLQSAQAALADYRDVPIELMVEDSHGTPEATATAMEKLLDAGVEVVLGPLLHRNAIAAAKIAANQDIPLLALNPHQDIAEMGGVGERQKVFLNAFQPTRQAQTMARHAVLERKLKRFAILAPRSNYGEFIAEAFTTEVEKLGGKVVRVSHFPAKVPDFSDAIKALVHMDEASSKARMKRSWQVASLDPADPIAPRKERDLEPWADFDALFLPTGAEQVRLIAPQAAFFNIRQPTVALLGTSLWNRPELLSEGTDYLKGGVFCDTDAQAREQFQNNYKKTWLEKPANLAMLPYDGVATLAQLLRNQRLGGTNWRDGITRPLGFRGAAGRLSFSEDGLGQRDYLLFKVDREEILPHIPKLKNKQPANQPTTAKTAAR
ncbi:MAG: penicillin-binding protein activator [Magnetococcales bacterium]|nr:penicillin-binding protein activator [Magnetococcales bacterium]